MTPLQAALEWFALTAFCPIAALALSPRARSPLPPLPDAFPDLEPATVVHEAGHAVLAWYCTAVVDVTCVNVRRDSGAKAGGHVSYRSLPVSSPAAVWCDVVVSLAGLAAELMVFGSFFSGRCASDLSCARRGAEAIVRSGYEPPGGLGPGPSLPFDRMFADPLPDQELRVLRAAYRVARDILEERSEDLSRLSQLLISRPVVGGADLRSVLGRRPFTLSSVILHGLGKPVPAGFVVPKWDR